MGMFNFHWLMVSLTPSLLIIDGDEEFCHSTEKLLSPEYKSKKPTKKKSSKNQKKKKKSKLLQHYRRIN